MADTYGSTSVNGQLVPVIGRQAIAPPAALGPMYSGPGQAPLATLPTGAGGTARAGSATTGGAGSGGNFTVYLVLIVMFAIGVLGLRYVHWGR